MTIIYVSDHKPTIDKQSDVTKSTAKETALQEDRNSIFNEQFKGVSEEKHRTKVCTILQSLSCQRFRLNFWPRLFESRLTLTQD